ncbi:MAG: alpha/beta hydrolase [Oscillospiraceae bacterium]|nr:alpha/beta hydrolase [Oscillospiraceae bacterium]
MKIYSDIAYGKLDEQKLDIYTPDGGDFPVFLYFHGGGLENGRKSGDDITRIAAYLTAQGIGFASADYRMYPAAVYPEFIRDAAMASAWVKKHIGEYGGDGRIWVGGSSAGGYLSMMLCFDSKYLAPYKLKPTDFTGFIHDAGQPTTHFNVLRERGIDSRRVIVDEAAPLYHICAEGKYPSMQFIVSDNDMEGRYEQTKLVLATLKHFGHSGYDCVEMHGTHCAYVGAVDEKGESVFAKMISEYIR